MTHATISVVIPCFNAGAFLHEAVGSVLQQSGDFELTEILIVDDRSDDQATCQALDSYQSHPVVRVLENTGVRGSASARNVGIDAARADWIVFLDADDLLLPDSIRVRLDAARDFPGSDWIGGDFVSLQRDGSLDRLGLFESNLVSYPFLQPAYSPIRKPIRMRRPIGEFLQQAPLTTSVCMVRKAFLDALGGFNVELLRQQDYHLFLRMAAAGDFVYVPQLVATYRLHDNNSTKSITLTQEWRVVALEKLKLAPAFKQFGADIRRQIFDLHLGNAFAYRAEGNFPAAIRASAKALVVQPTAIDGWKCLAGSILARR
jgi:glycosyltransferase involved in cell wall biosynthesis